ncbi:uncharacterized protein DUF1492 [Faecalicatena orotica]|uniref:Uncharacterized protein DUF1492 n=2 Tax=Faecalicatena orotica TaxID=1544 RepID=A0A2Y9BEN6_9FIRM|nr:uncharacterized protein DUF1492 [Faecalicatena orotica]SSA55959.1 Protein of unknown function [Faecalicatena orotica]
MYIMGICPAFSEIQNNYKNEICWIAQFSKLINNNKMADFLYSEAKELQNVIIESQKEKEVLQRRIDKIKGNDFMKKVLKMWYMDGMNHNEIASTLNIGKAYSEDLKCDGDELLRILY